MKILQFVHGFAPEFVGGVERYVKRLCEDLAARGHDVAIVSGTARPTQRTRVERDVVDGLPVHRIQRYARHVDHWFASDSPAASRLLHRLIDEIRPDVAHVNHWKRLSRSVVRVCAEHGVPTVVTLHDLWSTCPRVYRLKGEQGDEFCELPLSVEACAPCAFRLEWQTPAEMRREVALYRRDMRAEIRAADRVLSPTRAHRDFLCRMLGIAPELVDVLPLNAPRPPQPDPDRGPPRRFPETPLRLVHWGHLDVFKGAHVLLEAVQALPPKRRDAVEVHLFGESVTGEYERRLAALSEGINVSRHGRFTPDDINPRRFDVAVFPSLAFESHSLVLDEAFGFGLPVLASDRGAFAERVRGRGWLFEAGSGADLARRIESIFDDPGTLESVRTGMVAAGTEPAAKPGTPIESLIRIYREVMRRAPATPVDAASPVPPPSDSMATSLLLGSRHWTRTLEERNRVIESLRLKAQRLAPVLEDLNRHRQQRRELEREILEHRRVLDTAQRDLDEHRRVVADMTVDLDQHRIALKEVNEDLDRHRVAIAELRLEIETARSTIERLLADIQAHQRQHEDLLRERGELMDDRERHRVALRERDDHLKTLEEQLAVVRSERDELRLRIERWLPRRVLGAIRRILAGRGRAPGPPATPPAPAVPPDVVTEHGTGDTAEEVARTPVASGLGRGERRT